MRPFYLKWIFCFALLFIVNNVTDAQTIIWTESFETNGDGGARYQSSNSFMAGNSDHFIRTNNNNITHAANPYSGENGNYFWAAEDTDDSVGNSLDYKSIVFQTVKVSDFENLKFKGLFAAESSSAFDKRDGAAISYSLDGGVSFIQGLKFRNNIESSSNTRLIRVASIEAGCQISTTDGGFDLTSPCNDESASTDTLSEMFHEFQFSIPNSDSVIIKIELSFDSGDEEFAFDHFRVCGTPVTSCTIPSISGRDSTICAGETLELKSLLDGTFSGALRYGMAFENYTDTISTSVTPVVTTTFFVQDSVDGSSCVDTAQITLTIMECSTSCDIEITFSDTICNPDRTYNLKVTVDSVEALSDRLVAIIDGQPVDTLPYPVANGMDICIETGLVGDSSKSVQLIVADTMRQESMLFIEDFETDGNRTRYKTSIAEFKEVDSDFFGRTDGSDVGIHNVSGQSGIFYFGLEDVNANGASDIDSLKINGINVSLAEDLIFKGLFAEEDATDGNEDWDANTELKVQTQIDGGGFQTILQFSNTGNNTEPLQDKDFDGVGDGMALSSTFEEFSAGIPGKGNSLDILIIMEKFNDGDEDIVFDNLMIKGNAYVCSDTLIFNEPFCAEPTLTTLSDPCSCCNPENIDLTGDGIPDIFKETVVITSSPGETWVVAASTGILNITGTAIGTLVFAESPVGVYTSAFYHAGGLGFSAILSNGVSSLMAANSCLQCTTQSLVPAPQIGDRALCSEDSRSSEIIPSHAASIVLAEDFETNGLGNRYFLNRDPFSSLNDTEISATSQGKHFLIRTDGSNIRSTSFSFSNVQGSHWFGASDLNKNGILLPASATMTFVSKAIHGLCDLEFSVYLAEDDVGDGSNSHWNREDFVHFDYAIDGGAYQSLLHIESDGGRAGSAPFIDNDFNGDGEGAEITDTFQNFKARINAVGDSITLRISMFLDAAEEDIAFDSILIKGMPVTYNFYDGDPASGGMLLAANVPSYDPMVTLANSPKKFWVESACLACKGSAKSVLIGIHPKQDFGMICADQVYVSVDGDCDLEAVNISSFYKGILEPIYFDLIITSQEGEFIEPESLYKFEGERLVFEVLDTCSQNRCWGFVNVEDKLPPKTKNCPCDASISANLSPSTVPDSCKFFCYDSIIFDRPIFYDNCLPGITADTLGIHFKMDSTEVGCDTFQLFRTWFYNDILDGKVTIHEICKQVIYKLPVSIDSIRWPPDKLILACDSVGINAPVDQIKSAYGKHYAGPYVINNILDTILLTDGSSGCHFGISYQDNYLQTCINESQQARTWRVLDWCTQQYFDSTRLIDVKDKTKPDFGVFSVETEILDNDRIIINGDTTSMFMVEVLLDFEKILRVLNIVTPTDCSVDFEIPIFDKLADNCTANENLILDYEIDAPGAYFDPDNPRAIKNIPAGSSKILIKATDECGNTSSHTLSLIVLDKAPPLTICNETIVTNIVSSEELLDGGISQIPVSAFNLDAYDECGEIILTLARRMDRMFRCGDENLNFISTEYIEFCCEDIGKKIPVELTIFDDFGNRTTCLSHVIIEDKNNTSLTCEDVIVSCTDPLDPEHLGYPDAAFACGEQIVEYNDEFHLEELCYSGYVLRKWNILNSGVQCIQRITINQSDDGEDHSLFDPSFIKWPLHYTGKSLAQMGFDKRNVVIKDFDVHNKCNDYHFDEYKSYKSSINTNYNIQEEILNKSKMLPYIFCSVDILQEPSWSDPNCGLVGKTFEDVMISAENVECKALLRNWVVIDWCEYNANEGYIYDENILYVIDYCTNSSWFSVEVEDEKRDGYYTYTQQVKIVDDTPPVITVEKEIEVQVEAGNKADEQPCGGNVTLAALGKDYCGDVIVEEVEFIWRAQLVKINEDESTEIIHDEIGNSWRVLETNEEEVAFTFEGSSGENYLVKWRLEDGCHNRVEEVTKVSFIDAKAPSIICHGAISTSSLESHGEVLVWASDFAEAFDCNGVEVPTFFKDEYGVFTPYFKVSCQDLNGRRDSIFNLNIYAIDDELNESFCLVKLRIVDDSMPCSDGLNTATISGTVITAFGDATEGVMVTHKSAQMITEINGEYAFFNNEIGQNYSLTAIRNDDILNGVSTFDLLLIQNHILGLETFNTQENFIAADINNDGNVSAMDLILLRKVILGIEKAFPNNDSWRIGNISEERIDEPFTTFNEEVTIQNLEEYSSYNFTAIKVGDINGNARANSTMASPRNKSDIPIFYENRSVKKGEEIEVHFNIFNKNQLKALQLTLVHEGLEFIEIGKSGTLFNKDEIAIFDNALTLAWTDFQSSDNHELQFKFVMKALEDVNLKDALRITSDITKTLGYSRDGEAHHLYLQQKQNQPFLLDQIYPNPFANDTNIKFLNPVEQDLVLTIFNSVGTLVKRESQFFNQGLNEWKVDISDLKQSGLFIFQIENDKELISGKMIRM